MKYMIVGLGNSGSEYALTRHNIGFRVLDYLAAKYKVAFELKKYAYLSCAKYKARTIYLVKPSLYMNNSGKSVNYWLQVLKITPSNMLIVTDDLALPFAKSRLKRQGSAGGHNGLKDIEHRLQSPRYNRLRLGIGNNFAKGKQVDYVLSPFSAAEQQALVLYIQKAGQIVESFILNGVLKTMDLYN